MSSVARVIAHHSEAVDPTLIEWIRHQIDEIVGLEAGVIVVLLSALIVLFPVTLLALVWYQRRRTASKD